MEIVVKTTVNDIERENLFISRFVDRLVDASGSGASTSLSVDLTSTHRAFRKVDFDKSR